jgi:NADPH-dependent 2,4-dienoyl-CoA reductase/sulfur reductase-like enzyme/nitrite reductase/ring-hydroxylating ferredoxin subunit
LPTLRNAPRRVTRRKEFIMATVQTPSAGSDFAQGVPADRLAEGSMLAGRVGDEPALLFRLGGEFFAVGATCTHYGGPLAKGLVAGDTVRCPWHHACFSLKTGEALHAPAFDPLPCWKVEQRDGKIFAGSRMEAAKPDGTRGVASAGLPARIVIVGGGAAGFAAAEKLRHEGYEGDITVVSGEDAPPVDRPILSKEYLAGRASDDWLPLQPASFYSDNRIKMRLGANATGIDVQARELALDNGTRLPYDRLLLATGAEPVRLSIPGADLPHVYTLRSLADCRAIIERAKTARRAVVLGASFIGLEVAAALRARRLDVHVAAPGKRPMERILGPEMGDFVRALHEQHGVVFHLGEKPVAIDEKRVTLSGGGALDADLVVAGVGVRPRTALAESAGLAIDRGVVVDDYLETSQPGIFAAGDIARWPDRHTGAKIRVEHWVVAERQGQTAALNMLGRRQRFDAVPFFWSRHYNVPIDYVGHAESWDRLTVDGDIAAKDCLLRYERDGHALAVASIHRDVESLQAELAMERTA